MVVNIHTETKRPQKEGNQRYDCEGNGDIINVLIKDIPNCIPLSKEWEWWECCNHTIE